MLPSEKLRANISIIYNIDLSKYAWPKELYDFIMNIDLDPTIEEQIFKMEDVYKKGLNIGLCGLTNRYLAINMVEADTHVGICELLKGTRNAQDGNHSWTTINGILIDTTLMIAIKEEDAQKFGYSSKKVLAKESAKILPEYNTYSTEIKERLNEDIENLWAISKQL